MCVCILLFAIFRICIWMRVVIGSTEEQLHDSCWWIFEFYALFLFHCSLSPHHLYRSVLIIISHIFFPSSHRLSLSLNLFKMLKPMHLCYISHFLFCPRVRVRFCVRQQIQIQQNTNTISFLFCYLMRFSKQIRSNKENELETLKNSICFMLNIKYLYTCEGDTILSEMF